MSKRPASRPPHSPSPDEVTIVTGAPGTALAHGAMRTVPAQPIAQVPGLVLTPHATQPGAYAITHTATGTGLGGSVYPAPAWPSEHVARHAAVLIARLLPPGVFARSITELQSDRAAVAELRRIPALVDAYYGALLEIGPA